MRMVSGLGIVAAALLLAAAPPIVVREIPADGIIAGSVNGVPLRLRIDPGAPGLPLILATTATAAGLKPSFMRMRYLVGPERIDGNSAVAQFDSGAGPAKRRVAFFDRRYAEGIDSVAGPGALADPVVRFVLRPAVTGERTYRLPMVDGGGLFGGHGALFAHVPIGRDRLRIRFAPHHPRTLATAGAATRLAALYGGRMSGAIGRAEIAFGVERPVRTMRLARPYQVGPFAIGELGVRTGDFGNASGIPDSEPDPDEVVVTGKGKKTPAGRISIGADLLDRCSSLVFDKPAKQIRLSCR